MKNLVFAAVVFGACAAAQTQPASIAIRGAKIVTVSGPVIARGTVVLHNGLIEAVGENVQPPAGAEIIDGSGLTVYPGLIDALSTWGIPQPGRARRARSNNYGAGRAARERPGRPAAYDELDQSGG